MNGYSFPIHENTMKQITKSHRTVSLPVPSDETIGRYERTPSGQIKQAAHDDPPPPETHGETGRRDDGTRRAREQIKQSHASRERDEKNTRKTHRGQGRHNETPDEMRNETTDETSNDRKQIG